MTSVLTDEQAKANIAANIRRLRGDRSLSDVARAVGTHAIHISRIERGAHLPNSGLLARLAEAFGVTTDAMLSIDATKNSRRAS